jgi:streptomycin 6-kinase
MTGHDLPTPTARFMLDHDRGGALSIDYVSNEVRRLLARWGLLPSREHPRQGGMCYVVGCEDDAEKYILKVDRNRTFAGREIVALGAWNGRGAVRLADSTEIPMGTALLLERLEGRAYSSLRDRHLSLLADLLGQLHQGPTEGLGLPSAREQLTDIMALVQPVAEKAGHGHVHRQLLAMGTSLLATEADDDVLIHGDLSPSNVFETSEGTLRAVDPYGYIGPSARDIGEAAVLNAATSALTESVSMLSRACQADPARVMGFARLSAWTAAFCGVGYHNGDADRLIAFASETIR